MHRELLAVLLAPLVAVLLLWRLPKQWAKYVSLGVAASQFLYCLGLRLSAPVADTSFAIDLPWFSLTLAGSPLLVIRFSLGLFGLQWLMLLLATGILTLSALAAIDTIRERERGYHALFLVLCMAIPGCFMAQDGFLFYVFFEVMLIPMYFMVGLWGGAKREFAAIQFFIYTLVGSLLILGGFALCYLFENPTRQLGLEHLPQVSAGWLAPLGLSGLLEHVSLAGLAFWLLLLGFMVKLPAVPLHTWLPVAHTEAPTSVSILLAGVLLKTGGYGIFYWAVRLFPEQALYYGSWLAGIGVISIVYAAFLALAAHDFKRLVACSSISHMGFVLLGIATGTPLGYQGAAFQLVSHGVLSAGMFAAAGSLQHLAGTRDIRHVGGMATPWPRYAGLLAALVFGSMGLPGFSGFVGEFLVLVAAIAETTAGNLSLWIPAATLGGILLTSGYFLWALRRMVMGPAFVQGKTAFGPDVTGLDAFILWITVALSIVLGLYPQALLSLWDGLL